MNNINKTLEQVLPQYQNLLAKYLKQFNVLKKQSNSVSIARLVIGIAFVLFFYFAIDHSSIAWLIIACIALIIFAILVKMHAKIRFERKYYQTLSKINEREIDYLQKNIMSGSQGLAHIDPAHPYTHDLDIFGEYSLFQSIDRTSSFIGHTTLAQSFTKQFSKIEIEGRQKGILELAEHIDFRQDFLARAEMMQDSETIYNFLLRWTNAQTNPISKIAIVISYLSPILLTCCLLAYFISWQPIFKNGSIFLGVLNLGLLSYYFKRIKAELSESSKIDHILHLYSSIFEKIENTPFESQVLKDLSASFHKDRVVASERISRLSSLYAQLDNIQNPFGAFLFNGLFLFHFHVLRKLYRWKKAHAEDVVEWMSNFGELESLCSLANFYFNNPSYCFPSINENRVLNFEKLGHPLLAPDVRIPNSLDLRQQSFVILTGSNMSGKSTYLRCLGVNMVLAKMGAPICATKADIHPMQILASMRLSDSLHDSESYFFAEVKRLQFIMEQSENEDSFILLDEILRGTNSEDKREGTIEVIKKLCGRSVFGAIATHDLKVCATTDLYPDTLVNKCFEVETVHDELIFDYKLRDGICQNKSASFLMRKMGVI